MDFSLSVLIGPVFKIASNLWNARRFQLPRVVFEECEPRDNGPQRWWHIPVYIERPSFFEMREIRDVHVEIIVHDWITGSIEMRWQSDKIDGDETVTLKYHPIKRERETKFVPIVVRRSVAGRAYGGIELDAGEVCLSDKSFILYRRKNPRALFDVNREYEMSVRLWLSNDTECFASQRYSLLIPTYSAPNEKFSLKRLS